jgi:hypothetical protein
MTLKIHAQVCRIYNDEALRGASSVAVWPPAGAHDCFTL